MSKEDDRKRTIDAQIQRIRHRLRAVRDDDTRAMLAAILDLLADTL